MYVQKKLHDLRSIGLLPNVPNEPRAVPIQRRVGSIWMLGQRSRLGEFEDHRIRPERQSWHNSRGQFGSFSERARHQNTPDLTTRREIVADPPHVRLNLTADLSICFSRLQFNDDKTALSIGG
jgi:hypothetical protein